MHTQYKTIKVSLHWKTIILDVDRTFQHALFIYFGVGDGRVRAEDDVVTVELATAAFRDRFSTQRRRRRSSTESPPAVDVSPPSVAAVTGPSAESIALVVEGDAGATSALELIQTASPLRDH